MLLSQAECPIVGMSIDGQGNVLVNGRPIINLSGGERIKFVMNIVRATAGELKIILINGFEALSPKGQKEFIAECTGDGYQYIITHVTDGDLRVTSISESGTAVDAETGEEIV
jgi:exonuclease SbcC